MFFTTQFSKNLQTQKFELRTEAMQCFAMCEPVCGVSLSFCWILRLRSPSAETGSNFKPVLGSWINSDAWSPKHIPMLAAFFLEFHTPYLPQDDYINMYTYVLYTYLHVYTCAYTCICLQHLYVYIYIYISVCAVQYMYMLHSCMFLCVCVCVCSSLCAHLLSCCRYECRWSMNHLRFLKTLPPIHSHFHGHP